LKSRGWGWHNRFGSARASDSTQQRDRGGLETQPTTWDKRLLRDALRYEWSWEKIWPALAVGGQDVRGNGAPDSRRPTTQHSGIGRMMTTRICSRALRSDLRADLARFHQDQQALLMPSSRGLVQATSHRDSGPQASLSRPRCAQRRSDLAGTLFHDQHSLSRCPPHHTLKAQVLLSGLSWRSCGDAWASASTLSRLRQARRRQWRPLRAGPPNQWEGEPARANWRGVGGAAGIQQRSSMLASG